MLGYRMLKMKAAFTILLAASPKAILTKAIAPGEEFDNDQGLLKDNDGGHCSDNNHDLAQLDKRSVESCFGSCTSIVCLSKAADFRPGVRMYGLVKGVGCAALCACICGYKEYNGLKIEQEELYLKENVGDGEVKMNPAHQWIFEVGSPEINMFMKQNPDSPFEIEDNKKQLTVYRNSNDYKNRSIGLSINEPTCYGSCKQCCAKREDICNDYDNNSEFFKGEDHKTECIDKDLQACGNYYTNCNSGCPL